MGIVALPELNNTLKSSDNNISTSFSLSSSSSSQPTHNNNAVVSSLSTVSTSLTKLSSMQLFSSDMYITTNTLLTTIYKQYLPYWNIFPNHKGTLSTTSSTMITEDTNDTNDIYKDIQIMDDDIYRIGKSYFDNHEYARTAHWFDSIYGSLLSNTSTTTTTNNNNSTNIYNQQQQQFTSPFPSTAWFRYRMNTLHQLSSSNTYSLYPNRAYFLRCYALYLEGESKKEAERLQGTINNPSALVINDNPLQRGTKLPSNQYLMTIYNDLCNYSLHLQNILQGSYTTNPSSLHSSIDNMHHPVSVSTNITYLSTNILPSLDPFATYLLGIILRELERKEEAKLAFIYSIQKFPLNWSVWYDFTKLLDSKLEIDTIFQQYFSTSTASTNSVSSNSSISVSHWIYPIYQAYSYIEVHANTSALRLLQPLSGIFPNSLWLKSLVARGLYNIRRFEPANTLFRAIRYQDPYRMDDLDIYSNILYVKGDTPGLATLAHDVHGIGRYSYTPQSCTVIGNYFSARREHERAIIYFRRALRLDRQYTAAWTLMGHEYLELKNTTASIECYRRAVDTNPRDYRAWYGLGQTYELLHMFLYAAYYYRRTTALRPTDGRMWFALGSCYEQLERQSDAIACYERAANTDHDRDGAAAIKLAKLYRNGGNNQEAGKWYASYLEERELVLSTSSSSIGGGITKDNNKKSSSPSPGTSNTLSSSGNNNHPDVMEALLFLAKYAKEQKRWNDAEIYVQKIISLPLSTEVREARILLAEIRTGRTLDQRAQQQQQQLQQHQQGTMNNSSSSSSSQPSGTNNNHDNSAGTEPTTKYSFPSSSMSRGPTTKLNSLINSVPVSTSTSMLGSNPNTLASTPLLSTIVANNLPMNMISPSGPLIFNNLSDRNNTNTSLYSSVSNRNSLLNTTPSTSMVSPSTNTNILPTYMINSLHPDISMNSSNQYANNQGFSEQNISRDEYNEDDDMAVDFSNDDD